MRQFLIESLLYTVVSTSLAFLTVALVLPAFNHFVGKELQVPYFESPFTIPVILGFILLLGTLAGLYPAFFLSAFKPVSVLKDGVRFTRHPWTRSVLVVFQFSVAIALIIGTFVVRQQVDYIQEQKLEFGEERILIIHKADDLGREIRPFKQELMKNPHVLGVANSDVLVGGKIGDDFYKIPGMAEDAKRVIHYIFTDADFGRVYALKLIAGSFFPDEFPPDRRGLILNESAVRILGLEDPVGKVLERNGRTYPIVGVMKDFHYRSLHHPIAPLIIQVLGREAWGGREISVRISLDDIQDTIAFLERTWRQFTGNQAFEYEFFDDYYDSMYRAEMRTGGVFAGFTLFAVFIASLGLFGLSSFIVEQRTKEIGIRKVLGATVFGIVVMLTKQFIKWVLVSSVIAWPLAYLIMARWLQNFQYRTDFALWIFIVSSAMAAAFALITVGTRAITAARAKPVDSLRYE
jgi:putative ABC transport system permease protein